MHVVANSKSEGVEVAVPVEKQKETTHVSFLTPISVIPAPSNNTDWQASCRPKNSKTIDKQHGSNHRVSFSEAPPTVIVVEKSKAELDQSWYSSDELKRNLKESMERASRLKKQKLLERSQNKEIGTRTLKGHGCDTASNTLADSSRYDNVKEHLVIESNHSFSTNKQAPIRNKEEVHDCQFTCGDFTFEKKNTVKDATWPERLE